MYTISQLEDRLRCTYPDTISSKTQEKRLADIHSLQALIRTAKQENDLQYGIKEERLHLFTTRAGEKIFIQYPGKESTNTGEKYRPYDFRPRIMTADGTMVIDMVFADMWGVVEEINRLQHQILKLMACIFFRMGRMTLHCYTEQDYPCEIVNEDDTVVAVSSRHLAWYSLTLEDEFIESLNLFVEPIPIRGGVSISIEAFLYFFELILQNEDSKYYDKKHNLSSGRIPTSESMLLLSSYLFGNTPLSVVLQRFVSGFGVAKCKTDEIEPATGGLVKIVNRKQNIISYFTEHEIVYRTSSSITVNGKAISVTIKTTIPKIAILSKDSEDKRASLSEKGWTVYSLEDLVSEQAFLEFLSHYEN